MALELPHQICENRKIGDRPRFSVFRQFFAAGTVHHKKRGLSPILLPILLMTSGCHRRESDAGYFRKWAMKSENKVDGSALAGISRTLSQSRLAAVSSSPA